MVSTAPPSRCPADTATTWTCWPPSSALRWRPRRVRLLPLTEPIRPDHLTGFTLRTAAKAGLNLHLHQLRHFAATQSVAAGFDPVSVAARLGHADPSITLKVYSHALEQRDRQMAIALGQALGLPSTAPLHD